MAHDRLPFTLTTSKPCEESWAAMEGGQRARHCALCDKQVHNFAAMSSREIERVVSQSKGELCARITRRADGSLVTIDSRPRVSLAAQIVASASLVVGAASAVGQSSGQQPKQVEASPIGTTQEADGLTALMGEVDVSSSDGSDVTLTPTPVRGEIQAASSPVTNGAPSARLDKAVLTGTVLNSDGSGPVQNAVIMLRSNDGMLSRVESDEGGAFRAAVRPGKYEMSVKSGSAEAQLHGIELVEGMQNINPLSSASTITIEAYAPGESQAMMGEMVAVRTHYSFFYILRHPIQYVKHLAHKD